VVVNDSRNGSGEDALAYLTERYSQSGATVEVHALRARISRTGGIIDTANESQKKSRLRLFEIAAALADKYVPDADRPR
jgi:MinD-like ATPase involved in chromosome partitioning or flagellar assembly